MDDNTLIQSYVLNKWFVSTIHRQSSCVGDDVWFYETLVWEWNTDTRSRGNLLYQAGGVHEQLGGFADHIEVCHQLIETGKFNRPDYA